MVGYNHLICHISILILLTHCGGGDSKSNPTPVGEGIDVPNPDPEESPPPGGNTGFIMNGRVDSLILGADTNFSASAYVLLDNGARGAALGQGEVSANGAFSINLGENPSQPIELVIKPQGLGLSSSTEFRTRLASPTESTVAVSVITELASSRMDKVLESESDWEVAYNRSLAETKALTGVTNITSPPADLSTAGNLAAGSDSAAYALFIEGLDEMRQERNVNLETFVNALRTDFEDGSITGQNASFEPIVLGGSDLFGKGYAEEMRLYMKEAVKGQSVQKVSFLNIPALDSNPTTTIGNLDPSAWAGYTATAAEVFDHFIEVESDVSLEYANLNACLGPLRLKRINEYGTVKTQGVALPVALTEISSGTNGEYFSDAACTSDITTRTIAADQSTSADFYYKPGSYTNISLSFLVSSSDVPKVDYAYAYPDGILNGKKIGQNILVSMIESTTGYPENVTYVGDAVSPITRSTCSPAVVALSRGPRIGAVYPDSIAIYFNNSASSISAGSVEFFEDDACLTTITIGSKMTIPAETTHKFFYVKISNDYLRGVFPSNGFFIQSLIIPVTVTDISGSNRWYYAAP
jgi:hypothetical protein